MHWRRKWQHTPVFLPGESQGWGSLVGCHLWGRTESDMTEVTAAAAAAREKYEEISLIHIAWLAYHIQRIFWDQVGLAPFLEFSRVRELLSDLRWLLLKM